jgi:hypothetical protein
MYFDFFLDQLKEYLLENYPWTERIFGERQSVASRRCQLDNTCTAAADSIWSPTALGLQSLDPNDPRIESCHTEQDLDQYEVLTKLNFLHLPF